MSAAGAIALNAVELDPLFAPIAYVRRRAYLQRSDSAICGRSYPIQLQNCIIHPYINFT